MAGAGNGDEAEAAEGVAEIGIGIGNRCLANGCEIGPRAGQGCQRLYGF